mgnify:CR=1 FL=1
MRKTMFHYTSHIFTGDPSCSRKLKNFAQVIKGEIQNKSNYEKRRREVPLLPYYYTNNFSFPSLLNKVQTNLHFSSRFYNLRKSFQHWLS